MLTLAVPISHPRQLTHPGTSCWQHSHPEALATDAYNRRAGVACLRPGWPSIGRSSVLPRRLTYNG